MRTAAEFDALNRCRSSTAIAAACPWRSSPACGRAHPSKGSRIRGRLDFKVVLVHREPGEVAAYRGSGSDAWVAQQDKLSLSAAEVHFPGLAAALERDGLRYDE